MLPSGYAKDMNDTEYGFSTDSGDVSSTESMETVIFVAKSEKSTRLRGSGSKNEKRNQLISSEDCNDDHEKFRVKCGKHRQKTYKSSVTASRSKNATMKLNNEKKTEDQLAECVDLYLENMKRLRVSNQMGETGHNPKRESISKPVIPFIRKTGNLQYLEPALEQDKLPRHRRTLNHLRPPCGRKEYTYKVLVIGDLNTGKTSLINRYVNRKFNSHYAATVGAHFFCKTIEVGDNTVIRLQLWDIAGEERTKQMSHVYFKNAAGAFIVFDVSRPDTLEGAMKWKTELDQNVCRPDGSIIPCLLLANKCDMLAGGFLDNQMKLEKCILTCNFSNWIQTSAKEDLNIDAAAMSLVSKILWKENITSTKTALPIEEPEVPIILLRRPEQKKQSGAGCKI